MSDRTKEDLADATIETRGTRGNAHYYVYILELDVGIRAFTKTGSRTKYAEKMRSDASEKKPTKTRRTQLEGNVP